MYAKKAQRGKGDVGLDLFKKILQKNLSGQQRILQSQPERPDI